MNDVVVWILENPCLLEYVVVEKLGKPMPLRNVVACA